MDAIAARKERWNAMGRDRESMAKYLFNGKEIKSGMNQYNEIGFGCINRKKRSSLLLCDFPILSTPIHKHNTTPVSVIGNFSKMIATVLESVSELERSYIFVHAILSTCSCYGSRPNTPPSLEGAN
jgi:hypothetical protein